MARHGGVLVLFPAFRQHTKKPQSEKGQRLLMSFYNAKDNHYLRRRANSPTNASRERVAVVGSGILTVRNP